MTEFTFFWKNRSPFSNWYPSKFIIFGKAFTRAEQYMMYMKALQFNDVETAAKIMATDDPKRQKDLGREVIGYVDEIWVGVRYDVMVRGLHCKFSQNEKCKQALLDTGTTILAESSPVDQIWGIGLTADDPRAQDITKWRGQNLLGKVLMDVRKQIRGF